MEKLEDLVYLQVNGLNKLDKEILETNRDNRDRIDFDEDAIHRNEITGDMLLLTETAILERFSEKEVDPDRVTKNRMIRLSRMFRLS